MRVLITDILFPNKYAKWRLCEIKAFIEEHDTDILITDKVINYQINFDIDYYELCKSHHLDKYDILIFNPNYNDLNVYNDRDFDGKKFNFSLPFDFLFRLKKYRNDIIDLNKYDIIYHIFLMCYNTFKNKLKIKNINLSNINEYIHLYPGGGLINQSSLNTIQNNVKLIIGQKYILDMVKNMNLNNKYVEILGGPFVNKNEIIKNKLFNNGTINVCFTSIGEANEKGVYYYEKLIELYKNIYPNDNIKFYSIGKNYNIKNVSYLGLMSQDKLDFFYEKYIDILFNLETGKSLNGFPLGIEGLIRGVILFTTDVHNSNQKNNFNFGSEMRIIDLNNINDIIEKLHKLYIDRNLLLNDSLKIQKKSIELFEYENTMQKIFYFLKQ